MQSVGIFVFISLSVSRLFFFAQSSTMITNELSIICPIYILIRKKIKAKKKNGEVEIYCQIAWSDCGYQIIFLWSFFTFASLLFFLSYRVFSMFVVCIMISLLRYRFTQYAAQHLLFAIASVRSVNSLIRFHHINFHEGKFYRFEFTSTQNDINLKVG